MIRLNSVVRALAGEVLETEQHFTYVVIDDLDLTWVEDDVTNLMIKCLLQVALELQSVENLKIVVALRTNIFDQLHVGDQARGGQEEKLRAAAWLVKWTRSDLELMVDMRLRAAAGRYEGGKVLTLETLLPKATQRSISAWSFIVNRTLMRPRDVST